jgi:dihydroorotase
VCDPASGRDEPGDILVRDGKIANVGRVKGKADEVIDAAGKIVCPGLIDMHVHFREPGGDEAETIASGVSAAVAGGFTAVAVMPNTEPPVDTVPGVEYVYLEASRAGLAGAYPIGAITKGRRGEELAELSSLSHAGAVGFSDDGAPVSNGALMRRAMEYARALGKPVISHAEDLNLSAHGVMHEGVVSTRLGLAGISAASELVAVARDVILAETTGAHLHVAHVSVAGAVEVIRQAKARGVRVTAEATAHHLTLTDECLLERDERGILKFDTNHKMNPPLRTRGDVEALRAGLRDGTIDCIVSDHAPHTPQTKEVEFAEASFGVVGLETTLPLVITELIVPGVLSWSQAVAALTVNPARILGIPSGTLAVGSDADITIIDPDCEWTIDVDAFRSRSRNSPFGGRKVKGRAVCVMVGGEVKGGRASTG